jgi:hypothetical protein
MPRAAIRVATGSDMPRNIVGTIIIIIQRPNWSERKIGYVESLRGSVAATFQNMYGILAYNGNVPRRESTMPAWHHARSDGRFLTFRTSDETIKLPIVMPEINAMSMSEKEYIDEPTIGMSKRTQLTS